MLRNLSIVMFLALAACGGSKSQTKAPENTSTVNTTTDTSTANECCCQTEMHSCSMKATDECEQDDGNCTGADAASCDCEGGDEPE